MSDEYQVKETYDCIYTKNRNCTARLKLHQEFHQYMHLTLIYREILPSYCAKCPVLKLITEALIEEGTDWIESTLKERIKNE